MGKKILTDIFNHRQTSRPGWVPFAGIHAGKLVGHRPVDVLTDGHKLLEALEKVCDIYQPDGMPVLFDLQVAAEILGCRLQWHEDSVPSVKTHPLQGHEELPDAFGPMPTRHDGRLPMILDVMRKMSQRVKGDVALYGLICGPFTLASHLRGTDIFMDMYDRPEYLHALLSYASNVIKTISGMYIEAGMDVIAVVDPLVSQISSDHFKAYLKKPYTDIFGFIKNKGVFSSFFVCGDATRNIEVMCQTSPDAISVDENVDMVLAKEITDAYDITICGNIPLTTVMLHGSQKDNMKYVIDLMDSVDHHNLVVSPGCDMPYDIPLENVIGAAQALLNHDDTKKSLKNHHAIDYSSIDVDLPDYEHLGKPLVEVFTIDSSSCAACGYMMDVAKKMKEQFKDEIDLVEYKFTAKENIARAHKMGVRHLPSIYINGELKHSSMIPGEDTFHDEIMAIIKDMKVHRDHD